MLITTKIERLIWDFVNVNCKEPTLIIINPINIMDLIDENKWNNNYTDSDKLTYRGIKLIRSLDLVRGEIIVK